MENYFSNFIVNILLMVFAIISVIELIYSKSIKGSFLRKINKRGWILILIAFLSVAFNLYKDWAADFKQRVSDRAKETSDSLLRSSQNEILLLQSTTKDSIIKKVDSTYVKSIKASNEALAKYNLKITDSLNSVISKLNLESNKAQLSLAPLEKGKTPAFLTKDKEKNKLNIQFISNGGTSYNINLYCYFLIEGDSIPFTILGSQQISFGEGFLTEGVLRTRIVDIRPSLLVHSKVMVFFTGSFSKDPQGKIIIPFDYAFDFNFKENIYITGLDVRYKDVKKLINIK